MVWWLADDDRLDTAAAEAIASPANTVAVSAASAWELAIKGAAGQLETPDDLEERVDAAGMSRLDISFAHARAAGALPRHHHDPFGFWSPRPSWRAPPW